MRVGGWRGRGSGFMLGERVGEEEDIGRERIIFALMCGGDLIVIKRVLFPQAGQRLSTPLDLGFQ